MSDVSWHIGCFISELNGWKQIGLMLLFSLVAGTVLHVATIALVQWMVRHGERWNSYKQEQ